MSLYRAKTATMTGPFGTIKINQLNCSLTYLDYNNTTGPGDGGVATFDKGNKVFSVGLSGVLQNDTPGEALGNTFDDPVAVVLQFGNNAEQWAGNLEVQSIQTRSNYDSGGNIRVSLSGRFTGTVVVTDGS